MPSASQPLPEEVTAFLFVAIDGLTPLLERLGAERYSEVVGVYRDLLRDAIASASRAEVSSQGDSGFAVFASAAAAVAAQRALTAHSGPHAAAVRIRAGLHTGEAPGSSGDHVGMSVHHRARRVCDAVHHRARRVCDAGHGGRRADVERDRGGATAAALGGHAAEGLGGGAARRLRDSRAVVRARDRRGSAGVSRVARRVAAARGAGCAA